jgi:hypothetical protein
MLKRRIKFGRAGDKPSPTRALVNAVAENVPVIKKVFLRRVSFVIFPIGEK